MLSIAGIARSTFYYQTKAMKRADKYADAREAIGFICQKHKGRYGYRRTTVELRSQGWRLNHKTVRKLMKEMDLTCKVRTKRYKAFHGCVGSFSPNLLQRNFVAFRPNQKWVTDVTEFRLGSEKIFLSVILDLFNDEVVAYNIGANPDFKLVTRNLEKAFSKTPDNTNLILHSDQGWQYQMRSYDQMLRDKGIRRSMSRKGNCLDNAMAENFFSVLKSELWSTNTFQSVSQFVSELECYIDYYNHDRIKLRLRGLSPCSFRSRFSDIISAYFAV